MAKQGPRKKLPKELAVINADNCTGCEACLEVCPVDCIVKIQQYDQYAQPAKLVRDRPGALRGLRSLRPHSGQEDQSLRPDGRPWDAIEMVPTEQVAQVVAQIGGPPEYIHENWDRLVGTAQHLAESEGQRLVVAGKGVSAEKKGYRDY